MIIFIYILKRKKVNKEKTKKEIKVIIKQQNY